VLFRGQLHDIAGARALRLLDAERFFFMNEALMSWVPRISSEVPRWQIACVD
jgi:hypothetical protein